LMAPLDLLGRRDLKVFLDEKGLLVLWACRECPEGPESMELPVLEDPTEGLASGAPWDLGERLVRLA